MSLLYTRVILIAKKQTELGCIMYNVCVMYNDDSLRSIVDAKKKINSLCQLTLDFIMSIVYTTVIMTRCQLTLDFIVPIVCPAVLVSFGTN